MSKVPSAEKFLTLEPIVFVSSTSLVGKKQHIYPKETLLDGEKVSQFYRELVSSPPTINSVATPSKAVEQKSECYHSGVSKILTDTKPKKRKNSECELGEKATTSLINPYRIEQNNHGSNKEQKVHLVRPSSNVMFKYAETGDLEGMKKCLNSGLDVNSIDMYGWTCLMCAACSGSKTMTAYLLENGARRDLRSRAGKTAIELANDFGHVKVVEILTKKEFVDVPETRAVLQEKVSYFCKLCKKEFREEKSKHLTSITHQLCLIRPKQHTHYHLPESNIGFQLMLKEGWDKDKGLGPDGSGNKFPVKTIMKKDRACLGNKTGEKPRITHFQPFDVSAIKNVKQPITVTIRQRTLNKWQRAEKCLKDKRKEINFRRQFY